MNALDIGPTWRLMLPGSVLVCFMRLTCLMVAIAPPSRVLADIDPLSGIDFAVITHPGNPPWMGNGTPDDRAIGRGGVGYEYRIGRFEVTTSQWVEFFNAAYDRPTNDRLPHLLPPRTWGAVAAAPTVPGGQRWRVPAGQEMFPVGDISWRMAAIYCNWLHNGKQAARESFLSGAYDVSTFGYVNGDIFTDQAARSPGARYFIPTWDEWLKAVHFDPDRFGEDQPGWWTGPGSRDGILTGGPPGQGLANWGWTNGSWSTVPLGAYPVESPWGLKDAAGATGEWTESILDFGGSNPPYRILDGSYWGSTSSGTLDLIRGGGADYPSIITRDYGFRIAAAVPSPTMGVLGCGVISWITRRSRRTQ
jgi:formylglycine-generating enzyme required for sulfatase activity